MADERNVRMAVIGLGRMGAVHARELLRGTIAEASLSAVCDPNPAACADFPGVPRFSSTRELWSSGLLDAVLIATPHYAHTPLAIEALGRGLHVLTEKPIAVHKADALRMIAAYENRPNPAQVFAAMFNLRAEPRFLRLRELLQGNALGPIQRINWIATDWFRTEAYYRSSSWRATWRGEGGGVLQNQCPHNLDLWQWLFGMPEAVHAFCGFGSFHDIEVEDQVTAYFQYPQGKTGVFVASTGEAPGTNRLEVAGDLGRVVLDHEGFSVTRNAESAAGVSKLGAERAPVPASTTERLESPASGGSRSALLRNFVAAILHGEAPIAPAAEGLKSVELANAMLYSAWKQQTVVLPLDPALYADELSRLIGGSRH